MNTVSLEKVVHKFDEHLNRSHTKLKKENLMTSLMAAFDGMVKEVLDVYPNLMKNEVEAYLSMESSIFVEELLGYYMSRLIFSEEDTPEGTTKFVFELFDFEVRDTGSVRKENRADILWSKKTRNDDE